MSQKIFQPWNLSINKTFSQTKSSANGLSSSQVKNNFAEFGKNTLNQKTKQTAWQILLNQLKNYLLIVLTLAAIFSFFLGEPVNGIVILVMSFLSIIFGFIQEYKAEKALDKLKHFLDHSCLVFRDKKWQEISVNQLTIGDLVQLHIGDIVPADLRLTQVDELSLNESTLTGESLPVSKVIEPLSLKQENIAKLTNMALMGSSVASGRGVGVVTTIGQNTFYGQTATAISIKTPPTDFQKNLTAFSKFLVKVIFGLTIFIFIANFALHKGLFDSFLFAIALAVGVTPEMLPAIMTVSLSEGALKLAKKKVVVKKLISVEDLGNVDILCCDKTGTLTEGKFQLTKYIDIFDQPDSQVLINGILCTRKEKGVKNFNATDQAILEYNFDQNQREEVNKTKIVDENEFDFERKMMSVVVKKGRNLQLIAKGATESILKSSSNFLDKNQTKPLSFKNKVLIEQLIEKYESQGNRVLAVANKTTTSEKTSKDDEKNLTFIGLLIFSDPLKKGIGQALAQFQQLGVKIKIISGDSQLVTSSIASQAQIEFKKSEIIDGEQLSKLTALEFKRAAEEKILFCRVSPQQKKSIVAAISSQNHVVGFLGDGVNDAPALKMADVGISVNTGSAIAKDSADIILLQKDLTILADGIAAGRKTFSNITKYIFNTISANYGNMLTVALSSLFLKFLPLMPSQILLNNFMSDLPLLVVATDNVDSEFIQRPKKWNIALIAKFMIFFGLISSMFDLALILPAIFIFHLEPNIFRTAWFIESSISEILITFAIRTRLPFFKSRPGNALMFVSAIVIMVILIFPFTGWGNQFFDFQYLTREIWLLIGLVIFGYFVTVELTKHLFYKYIAKE